MDFRIRLMDLEETDLLKEFTYQAIFQRDSNNLIPRDILELPEMKGYYENFDPEQGDICLLAVTEWGIGGAVWCRILSGTVRGFGNLDKETPEFAIALYPQFRGYGVGTALMESMLEKLREAGYTKTSLAVQKDNYAVRMYRKVGFYIVNETEEEYIMVCPLN